MTSRRKQLEQQIARTDDPAIQMQLRELLNKKGKRHDKRITRVERALYGSSRQAIDRLPDGALLVLIVIVVTFILLLLFLILEAGA